MAADGVFTTPSDASLWAIYTDLHGSATRGAVSSVKIVNSKCSKHNIYVIDVDRQIEEWRMDEFRGDCARVLTYLIGVTWVV